MIFIPFPDRNSLSKASQEVLPSPRENIHDPVLFCIISDKDPETMIFYQKSRCTLDICLFRVKYSHNFIFLYLET